MPTFLIAITFFSVTLDIRDVHGPLQWPTDEGGNGHVYQLVTPAAGITWTQAEELTQKMTHNRVPGHLVTITSPKEMAFVNQRIIGSVERLVWIGLTDEAEEGAFQWVTGEPFDFENWGSSEPNNAGNEDYALIHTNQYMWVDFLDRDNFHGPKMSFIVEYDPDRRVTPDDADRRTTVLPEPSPSQTDLERGTQLFAQRESGGRPPSHQTPDTHEAEDDEDGPPMRIVRQEDIVQEQAEQKKVDTDKLVSTILVWAASVLGVVVLLIVIFVATILIIDRSANKRRSERH